MRSDPCIWIKLKEINEPQTLNRTAFEALKAHIEPLMAAGIEIVSGHEKDWAYGVKGLPRDWLSHPYHALENSTFTISGVLVYAKCLREVHRGKQGALGLIKAHIGALIEAGIAVGGGEHSVKLIFHTTDEFNAWADNPPPEFQRRNPPAPFCPFPREQ